MPLLNKAGGAGFQVTAYTQTWSDVEARIGNRAKAGQVAGNFNTLLMLRVKELATAEMLTDQLPKVEVFTLMSVSGVTIPRIRHPVSTQVTQRRPHQRLRGPDADTGRTGGIAEGPGLCAARGGQLWKLRMPLPDATKDPVMPESLAAVANENGTDLHHPTTSGTASARPGGTPLLMSARPAVHRPPLRISLREDDG